MTSNAETVLSEIVSAEDSTFMDLFERCELPEAEWTHLAHIHVTWVAFMSDPAPAALQRIREGILRYNTEVLHRRHKYHETVTVAFARIVADRLDADESWNVFERRIDDILSADEPILMSYYSAERLFSDRARQSFVAPDVRPLPALT